MTETEIQREIMKTLNARPDCTIYRNNTGAAKMGRRWVKFGVCKGSSDLIGWTSKTITEEMVGQSVAVFTAIECKSPGCKTSKEQIEFGELVTNAGGIFAISDSTDSATDAIENELKW